MVEVFLGYELRVVGKILRIQPKPEYDWGEQLVRRHFQILDFFHFPVETRCVLKQGFDFFKGPLLHF